MLRLEHRGAADRVRPVLEAARLVIREDVVGAEAVAPRVREPLFRAPEVVLDVALRAHEGAHLLARGVDVDVERAVAEECAHALDEPGTRDAKPHRLRIVAVDARHRVRRELGRVLIRHLVDALEAADEIAVTRLLVDGVHGRVAVQAGAGLLHDVLPLGEDLVDEHVRVPALLAKILGERVARPELAQPRVFHETGERLRSPGVHTHRLLGDRFAPAVARANHVHGVVVQVVLNREISSPHGGIHDRVVELHYAVERIPRLLLALEDVGEQRGQSEGDDGRDDGRGNQPASRPAPSAWGVVVFRHDPPLSHSMSDVPVAARALEPALVAAA